MRAADTAAGAAATQPAGKPRLKRVMKAHLVNLWHTVAAAGPEGTTVEALTEQLPDASAKQLSTALSYLRTLDYVATAGGRKKGARWWATGVPVACVAPDWMRAGEMPRRPSSVFALAAAPIPSDWTLKGRRTPPPASAKLLDDDDDQADGVDIDAAHTRPKPDSTAASLAWVAPPAAQREPDPPFPGLKEGDTVTGAQVLAHLAEATDATGSTSITGDAVTPGGPFTTYTPPPPYLVPGPANKAAGYSPHFALHSDGTFEIHDHGDIDPIVLQPDTTRALFRWLDRLGGTHLSRTVEAA